VFEVTNVYCYTLSINLKCGDDWVDDGWVGRGMDEWLGGWIDGWIDEWIVVRTNG
jgi:hypothetical protein